MVQERDDVDIEFELQEQDAYDGTQEMMTGGSEGSPSEESDDAPPGYVVFQEGDEDSEEDSDDEDDPDYEAYYDSDEEFLGAAGQSNRGEAQRRTIDVRYLRATTFQKRQRLDHQLACETELATHATTCTVGPEAVANASPEKRSTVNVTKMLFRREANLTGAGRFRKSDYCHLGLRHIPQHRPVVRDEMHSRGYIGQYSENGEWFIGGFQDRRIKIYEVNSNWRTRREIIARGLRWTITDTCMSPDRNFLLYSSITPVVHMVSTAQSYEVNMNEDEKDHYGLCLGATYDNFGIWGISFSQDGREIVAGTSDARMLVYDVETNKNVVNIDAHEDDVNSVAFVDERSNLVVSGSDDCLCKVWDRRTASGSAAGVFVGHTEGITHVTPKGDGRYFISNSKDQSIKLWDLRAMHSESQAAAVSTHAGVKRYHWDYRWMEYPPFGKTELAYQAHPHDTSIMTYRGHAVLETLVRCYFSPLLTTGQRYIYTGSHDGRIYIYDVISGDVVALLEHHVAVVRDCSWHPTEAKLASCSWDGSVVEWSYDAKQPFLSPRLLSLRESVKTYRNVFANRE